MRNYLVAFYILLLFFCLILPSCADYQIHYARGNRAWHRNSADSGMGITHTMFLIGDAGNAGPGEAPPALRLLGEQLKSAGPNSSVVFLGDNIYPNGMASKSEEEEYAADEYRLKVQLDILKEFKGKPYFLPGNHDWYQYGIEGLERQRRFIEKYLNRSDVWFPRPGCGDPVEITLGENLVLVLVDTQWWLTNWKEHPQINVGCVVKSRSAFKLYFEEAIKGNRDKNIVVAMHHPPFSNGPHGGQFTLRQHLFPLTEINKNLYVPMPLLGSLYPFLRATVGSRQDQAHPDYQELRNFLVESARKNGEFIFASGHEHSLQYLEQDEQHFIVSGAGSKRSAAKLGNGAEFSYGGAGFAQLEFYEDGSAWVQFWTPEGDGATGRVIYRRQVKGPLSALADNTPRDFSLYNSGADSIPTKLGAFDFQRNRLGRWFWGEHYRDAYHTEVQLPVLDLRTFEGGVAPQKRGGGYQTNSLRLKAADGRQFTMRSLDKDPTRTVPYPLNKSEIILNIVKDGFSGAHPMAATPLPALQRAVNLYYTNPKLYYVPKQPILENFNQDFGDGVYLVEERPDDDAWREADNFGRPKALLSTDDVVEQFQKHHDHVIDQNWVLRARLFDVMVGDWDRHDDQWRWARIDSAGATLYRPIPRDRDQALSKYDGFMYSIARGAAPAARPLRPFLPNQKRIWWSNFGARYFDPTFLSGVEWSDWEREVRAIQRGLPDPVIESAFRESWPEVMYRQDGAQIVRILEARRDNLLDMARGFYLSNARKVDVVGTSKRDLFEVERLSGDETVVRVYDTNKEGEREGLYYERTFHRSETREIRLYGLANEDIFRFSGKVPRGIPIRAIGGPDKDAFIDESQVGAGSKKTIIYDVDSEESRLEVGPETRLRISPNPEYNTYNRRSKDYEHDYWLFFPSLSGNPDDGVQLGATASFTHFGFRQEPYAGTHSLGAKYAFGSSGVELSYRSEFVDAIGKWELTFDGLFRTPLYARNFYGLGNESVNPEDSLDTEFNRVRQREFRFAPSLMKISNSALRFSFGPTYEAIEVERTPGRFIDYYAGLEDSPLAPDFFEGQHFVGLQFRFDYRNVDNEAFPGRGVQLSVDAGWKTGVNNADIDFPYLDGFVAGFFPLELQHRLVFGTRVGWSHRFNNEFVFYQGAVLGGTGELANFRGVRRDRYIGRTAFYQNIDLRWQLLESFNRSLPLKVGIYAGFDHGRVWLDEDVSNKWHYSYGGGLFLVPLDMLSAQFSLFRADRADWLFQFSGRFLF